MSPTWRARVVDYIRAEATPADKYGHQPRVYSLATEIGRGMAYDDDILFAAAWMHDLGVFLGHRPQDPEQLSRWDHVGYTIQRSRDLLSGWGFPREKMEGVAEAILHHQSKDEPLSVEATLLRDADILEQLGAIAVMRAAAKVGRDTRYPSFSSILPVLRSAAEELPGKMRLTQTKVIAQSRVEMLRSFLDAIKNEAGDQLY
ncbi:HD domain-containing protein [Occallatibacter savannae]|uniref:HD domain-containing protein n=1 Tax=Occallatibacter savannae TaxID=1002691 RepID=UPI000D6A0376|nr:HD domain-containing protein [Occallatibacter savannae]